PYGDVEVVGLVDPLAGAVLLAGVDGDAQLADGGAARRLPQLRVAGQVADKDDPVDVGHYSSPPSPASAATTISAGGGAGVAAAVARRCGIGRRVARWRITPSVILRTRLTSSSASGVE